MKLIYDAANSIEAHMILNLLEQAGLSGRIDGEFLQGGVGDLQAFGIVRVMIEDEDYDQAKVIVDDWDAQQPAEVTKTPVVENEKSGSGSLTIRGGLALALFAFAYWFGFKAGQVPEVIYQASSNQMQGLRNDSVFSASIFGNEKDQLFVYVNYFYSGEHGERPTACGSITSKSSSRKWTCSPAEISKGRGFVTLRFDLDERARNIECSDGISIEFNDWQGRTFFEKALPYEKTWMRGNGTEGAFGKIKEIFATCP